MNKLINATEYGSSTQAFFSYEDYAARQLPWLWLPDSDYIQVYKSNLAGLRPAQPVLRLEQPARTGTTPLTT